MVGPPPAPCQASLNSCDGGPKSDRACSFFLPTPTVTSTRLNVASPSRKLSWPLVSWHGLQHVLASGQVVITVLFVHRSAESSSRRVSESSSGYSPCRVRTLD
jgi:hypothetical protein